MKVALIHPQLILKGGLETRLFNYIKFFHARGDEVTVIAYKVDDSIQLPDGVKVRKIDLSKIPKPVRMFFFDRALPAELEKDNYDFTFSLGRTSHQQVLLCPGNHIGYLKGMKRKFYSPIDYMNIALDRKGFKNSELILAASGMIKQEVEEYYKVYRPQTIVAYPPLDTTVFNQSLKTNQAALRKKFNFSDNKKTFLFVSTSHDRKNFPLLEQVFRELQHEPVELAIAGFEAQTFLPNVKNLGYIRTMNEVYAAADFLIHPALYEPFGQIVSESICCGTPVIVSEMVGAKEIVSEKEGIVVKGFEVYEWMTAIQSCVKREFSISPDFAVEHGLTLEQHMEKVLAMKHTKEQILEIAGRVMGDIWPDDHALTFGAWFHHDDALIFNSKIVKANTWTVSMPWPSFRGKDYSAFLTILDNNGEPIRFQSSMIEAWDIEKGDDGKYRRKEWKSR